MQRIVQSGVHTAGRLQQRLHRTDALPCIKYDKWVTEIV